MVKYDKKRKEEKMNYFLKAKPVWAENEQDEKNTMLTFFATITKSQQQDMQQTTKQNSQQGLQQDMQQDTQNSTQPNTQKSNLQGLNNIEKYQITIAANNAYRICIDDKFVASGPARCCKEFFRADILDLSNYLKQGENKIQIDVVGYNTPTYQSMWQPAFLQAEISLNGEVLLFTDEKSETIIAYRTPYRIRKTIRYCFQRSFIEAYDFRKSPNNNPIKLKNQGGKTIIERRVSYPKYFVYGCDKFVYSLNIEKNPNPDFYDGLNMPTDILSLFDEDEIEANPMKMYQEINEQIIEPRSETFVFAPIKEMSGEVISFERELSGFIGIEAEFTSDYHILICFDEVMNNNKLNPLRMSTCNVLSLKGNSGKMKFESFEIYSLKFIKIYVLKGEMSKHKLYVRTYENADSDEVSFECENAAINAIFNAARETFKQNAVDIFMDCPSRERCGWLCDSFFTARTERILTGKTEIEKNFLENFLLQKEFEFIPDGMIPMCHPADHHNKNYIPNWAMWFVIECEEYLQRSDDIEFIKGIKDRIYKLITFFEGFENEFKLLEKLGGWIFVDWSKANEYVQDVSYPSNMMYYAMLKSVGRLYNDSEIDEKANNLKNTILSMSFNGEFFIDNAIRNEKNELVNTENITEACQDYAFFTNIADDKSHPELFRKFLVEFGPDRVQKGLYPHIEPAQAFIGNYLRMEILSRYGKTAEIIKNMEGYMLYMAEKTGTLWELVKDDASCNHGFASHAIYWIYKNFIGVESVDEKNETIMLNKEKSPVGKIRAKLFAGKKLIGIEKE